VIFVFEEPHGGLVTYRSTSPDLETEKGDTVGDPFSELRANWGKDLKPFNLGAKSTPQTGFWELGSGSTKLNFDIRKGKIAGINGGEIQVCE
jgi:hypothetical protein